MLKMWLCTSDGELLNADYVVRIYEDGGKVYAELRPLSANVTSDPIELQSASNMHDMRVLLAANGQRLA